ncbi:hypothetical protein ABZ281_45620, partial [Streptomyces sp. NPDC006265]
AALDAVYAAVVTYGEDHSALLAEVWSFCEERPASPGPRFTPDHPPPKPGQRIGNAGEMAGRQRFPRQEWGRGPRV